LSSVKSCFWFYFKINVCCIHMKRKFFCLFLLLFLACIGHLHAQNDDSLMRINRKFKREISIDAQGIFRILNTSMLNIAFIYKVRTDHGRFISVTSAKNYRFLLAFEGGLPVKNKAVKIDQSIQVFATSNYQRFSIHPLVGMEKVRFYDKFNFYYGIDLGPLYEHVDSGYDFYYYDNTNTYSFTRLSQNKERKVGVSAIPFVGVKYRFTERFSISLESSIFLTYYQRTTESYLIQLIAARPQKMSIATVQQTGLEFFTSPLRFLSLNYHIK
jgi:hypothetical protein